MEQTASLFKGSHIIENRSFPGVYAIQSPLKILQPLQYNQ
jgi:hypothetical protein